MVKHKQRRAADGPPTFMDILLDLRQDPILQAMFGEQKELPWSLLARHGIDLRYGMYTPQPFKEIMFVENE